MELYTLDSLFRREWVVEKFETLIWTERMRSIGDFELHIPSSNEARNLLKAGTHLAINESHRVMTVETIEDSTNAEGEKMLKITGRSLEQILDERLARDGTVALDSDTKWVISNTTPGDIARYVVNRVCVLGEFDPGDIIPLLQATESELFPDDSIPESDELIEKEVDISTVYAVVKEICDLYDLGFRLVRNFDSTQLHFDIYSGSDRTTLQDDLPAVIFSPDLENLQNTTELMTTDPNRNVAYVFSPVGFEIVYAPGVDPEVEGFERRVLVVIATDITDTVTGPAAMQQRGREELTKNRSFSAFDGELNQNSQYKYGVDYHLGDLVELRTSGNATSNMRVTEQIFVSDAQGERSYPTLAIDLVIEAGTWLSWNYQQVWEDLGLTEYWENAGEPA